ncbi:MAG: hypothetical protein AAB316_05915, partial [Bacteroidota bacterium]
MKQTMNSFLLGLLLSMPVFLPAQILPFDTVSLAWEKVPGIPGMVNEFASASSKIFAATATGLYVSYDLGENWQRHPAFNHEPVVRVFSLGDTVFAQRDDRWLSGNAYSNNHQHQILRSTDGGSSFSTFYNLTYTNYYSTQGGSTVSVQPLRKVDSLVYCKMLTTSSYYQEIHGVRYSPNAGSTWHHLDLGNVLQGIAEFPGFHFMQGDSLAGVGSYNLFKYNGFNLASFLKTPLPSGLTNCQFWVQDGADFLGAGNSRFAKTQNFSAGETASHNFSGIYFFKKAGDAWFLGCSQGIFMSTTSFPFDFQPVAIGGKIMAAAGIPGGYFVGSDRGFSFRSLDSGATWQQKDSGLSFPTVLFEIYWPKEVYHSWIFAKPNPSYYYNGNYFSKDGANWQLHVPAPSQPAGFSAAHPISRFGDFWLDSYGYRSFDGGQNWQLPGAGFSGSGHRFSKYGDRIFGFNNTVGYQLSTDLGTSWTPIATDSVDNKRQIFAWGDTLVSLGSQAAVSYDNGSTWKRTFTQVAGYPDVVSFVDEKIRLHTTSANSKSYLYTSADKGATWTASQTATSYDIKPFLLGKYWCMVEDGLRLYVSGNDGQGWILASGEPANLLGALDQFPEYGQQKAEVFAWEQDGFIYILSPAAGIWRTSVAQLDDQWNLALQNASVLKVRLLNDPDCLDNGNETTLPSRTVRLQPSGVNLVLDANGEAVTIVPTGTYSVQATPGLYEEMLCTDSLAAVLPGDTACLVKRIFRMPGKQDLVITVIPNGAFRPGFDGGYKILLENVGTAAVQGVELTTDFVSPWLSLVSANPPMDEPGKWLIPEIQPGQSLIFFVHLHLDAGAPLGEIVSCSADALPVATDETPGNNHGEFRAIITGSFDPNDKNGFSPQGEGQIHPLQPEITYQIRFQNTGTDTAFNVRITDRIDTVAFDLLTLRMIAASHDYS